MAGVEEILDELEHLSTVEHALCAEYLFLHCALGDDVAQSESPTDVDTVVAAAAATAFALADREMRLLRRVNRALSAGERRANIRRATHVRREAQPPLALAPLTAAQLAGFLDREHAVALAVDDRYARLPTPSAPPAGGGFDEALLEAIGSAAEDGVKHAAAFGELRSALSGLEPEQYLRATRDAPADDFERGLRQIADDHYRLVLSTLDTGLAHEGFGVSAAVSAMMRMGEAHSTLVARGLLPALTLPEAFVAAPPG